MARGSFLREASTFLVDLTLGLAVVPMGPAKVSDSSLLLLHLRHDAGDHRAGPKELVGEPGERYGQARGLAGRLYPKTRPRATALMADLVEEHGPHQLLDVAMISGPLAATNGDIVHALFTCESTAKQRTRPEGHVALRPEHERYKAMLVGLDDESVIHGTVVALSRSAAREASR